MREQVSTVPADRGRVGAPPFDFSELEPPLSKAEAILEATRCLECGGPLAPAPCIESCPTGIDIPGFITAIARGDLQEAADTIFSANALGGTCARVCPTEVLCAGTCVLEKEGRRPVRIGALQRHATDWAMAEGPLPAAKPQPNGLRVAVIGAGPSGLGCAAELAALGYTVTVHDGRPETGGLVRYAIAPYRQWSEPLPAETARLIAMGVQLRLQDPIDRPERLQEIADSADAVFLGIGLGEDIDAQFGGDDLPGVHQSLPFIEAIKAGYPPAVGRRVAVIGGGNTAMDVAREALRLGAGEVTVLYRRTESEMPAFRHEVLEAMAEGICFEWLTAPIRFVGTDRLEGVECRRMRLGEPDATGRRRPEPIEGSEFLFGCDTAVKAIGQRPRSEFLDWVEGLRMEHGHIAINPGTGQTGNPKFFSGGDAVNGGATVVQAVQAGRLGARGIDLQLRGRRP